MQRITQQQLDDATAKYGKGNVKVFDLPKDDDGTEFLEALFKRPGRGAISQYQMWIDKNPQKANEILVNDSVVDEDDKKAIKADDGLFFAAVDAAAQMMPIRKAILKNS